MVSSRKTCLRNISELIKEIIWLISRQVAIQSAGFLAALESSFSFLFKVGEAVALVMAQQRRTNFMKSGMD
jgi:hypothetical protein